MQSERVNYPLMNSSDYLEFQNYQRGYNMTNQYTVIGTRNDPRIGSCPWFWMWFWGPFYLLYKGMFGHFVIWCLTFWLVIPYFYYIIMARDLVFYNMQKKGMLR